MTSNHYVYLVRCADGSFYCGYARDPIERVKVHNGGRGSKILRGKLPVTLAYAKRLASKGDALRYEAQLKTRSHSQKNSLSRRWLKRLRRRGPSNKLTQRTASAR